MGSTANQWHSAPEVVPDTGLHVVRDDFPEPVHPQTSSGYSEERYPELEGYFAQGLKTSQPNKDDLPEAVPPEASPKKRICGLAPRSFWILLAAIAVVIVGAAIGIGAGVGLSISNRSQSTENSSASSASSSTTTATSLGVVSTSTSASASASSSSSSAPTTTSAQSTSVTTTQVVGPSSTLYRDCPSSDNTIHDVTLGDETYMFRKFCSTVLVSIRGDNDNLVSTPTSDLNSCINQCAKYNYESASDIASGDKDKW